MNAVHLVGRAVAAPELRATNAGSTVTTLRLAVDRRGDREALFVNVDCWDKLAETVARYVGKGRLLAVSGRLESNTWTDNHGTKRTDYVVVATAVDFLDRPKEDTQGPDGPSSTKTSEASQ